MTENVMSNPTIRVGVLVFPGSNCDRDCYEAVTEVLGARADFIWHKDPTLPPLDAVIIPGGFSYGDYLRTGAIARFSPVMAAVTRFAESGGLVLGICNGDRKSTRLNSSHVAISYAVFCLKKKIKT